MSRPVSPAYLLLWHASFKDMGVEDRARCLESIAKADLDPLEYVDGKSAVDRFLEVIPQRDTVFAHDMLCLLYERGVRSVSPPVRLSSPAFSITATLLRELNHRGVSSGRIPSLRLAAGLLESVYEIRPATKALADVKSLVRYLGEETEIDGLSPQVWLATRGVPARRFDLPEIEGWPSKGSDSEVIQMGGRLVRGLSRQMEENGKAPLEQRLAMDIALLAWSGPSNTMVDPAIIDRWQDQDPASLADLVSQVAKKMGQPDQNATARVSALLLMAAKELGVAAKSMGKEREEAVAMLGSRLLLQGLKMRQEGQEPLLARSFIVDLIEKVQHSEHSRNGIVRAMAKLPGGAEEALSLWTPFASDTFPDAQEFAMYAWVDNTVKSLFPQTDRFLEAIDSLGEPFERALEYHEPLKRNILPMISKAREIQMARLLPKGKKAPAGPSRRF